jgi:hypothetical protein
VDGRKDDQKKGPKTLKNGAKTINFELFYALYVGF